MIHDLNKKALVLVLLVTACLNKHDKGDTTKNDLQSNQEFDFKYDKVKMFHFNSYHISNKMLIVKSSCSASEINFLTDVSILKRILYRNRKQVMQSKVDSIRLVVEYNRNRGECISEFSTKQFLSMSPDFDENKVNYYNKVADLMYSDTFLYVNTDELALHIYYQLYGSEKIFDNYRYFDCFDFFMKVNQELMRNDPVKYHYDAWMRMEEYLKKNKPGDPILKRVDEISRIFSMDLSKGKKV